MAWKPGGCPCKTHREANERRLFILRGIMDQDAQIDMGNTIRCAGEMGEPCKESFHAVDGFKCFHCWLWFCQGCARTHFGPDPYARVHLDAVEPEPEPAPLAVAAARLSAEAAAFAGCPCTDMPCPHTRAATSDPWTNPPFTLEDLEKAKAHLDAHRHPLLEPPEMLLSDKDKAELRRQQDLLLRQWDDATFPLG